MLRRIYGASYGRTHNGILSAASGIVDLLEHFFPASIDSLPREQGFFAGPKPMLLSQTAVDDAAVMIVGAGAGAHCASDLFTWSSPYVHVTYMYWICNGYVPCRSEAQSN